MKTPCTMTASKDEKPGCLSNFFPSLRRTKAEAVSEPLPYRVRDDFLSPAEFSFYKVLMSLVGTHLTIQSKVRLADIFFVARPNENFAYLGKIAQKHVDFLVCDSLTMKPVFGVELEMPATSVRTGRNGMDLSIRFSRTLACLCCVSLPGGSILHERLRIKSVRCWGGWQVPQRQQGNRNPLRRWVNCQTAPSAGLRWCCALCPKVRMRASDFMAAGIFRAAVRSSLFLNKPLFGNSRLTAFNSS